MKPLSPDTHPEIEKLLIEAYRRMPASQKLQRVRELNRFLQRLALSDIRRRYPERLRIHLVNDNFSLHWTPQIRAWAVAHNMELVPTPTSASHLNRTYFNATSDHCVNSC